MFMAISAFHRFNLPINLELLARSVLGSDYEKLREAMADRKFRETIVEIEDWEGNIVYSTHNPIIAQRTFAFFLPDRVRRKELYCQILGDVHFAVQKEKELVERLLIRNMGPNRNLSDLKPEELLEIFRKVCEKSPTRSLLHHMGLLYVRIKDFEAAESTLLRALRFHERFVEAYRGESNQNILTSLGSMYIEWAKEKQAAGDNAGADTLYKKAETYLTDAMKGRYPKPHPYHAMARMYLQLGDDCGDDPRRYDFYAKALETTDLGKKNIEELRTRALFEIEVTLYERLQNEKAITDAISTLEKKYSSPRGYYIYAKTLVVFKPKHEDRKIRLEKALETVKKGLKSFPADEPLMKLRAEIIEELYPKDLKRHFEALEQWFAISKWQDIDLMYDLAVDAFILGYYPTSFRVFGQLERRSSGYRDRFKFARYFLEENGEKKKFDGTIVRIIDPYEGEIRVDSLPNLDRNIRFRTETVRAFIPRENDVVSFCIGFNYVSPECVDVEKPR